MMPSAESDTSSRTVSISPAVLSNIVADSLISPRNSIEPVPDTELRREAIFLFNDVKMSSSNFSLEKISLVIAYVFSGTQGKPEGFEAACQSWAERKRIQGLSVRVLMLDLENGIDISDSIIWGGFLSLLSNEFLHSTLWSPPCSSFSPSRNDWDGGPGILRDSEGPGRYGILGLDESNSEKVKIGNLLAIRTAEGIEVCEASSLSPIPWLFENPGIRPNKPSIYMLDETRALNRFEDSWDWEFPQCQAGAAAHKLTCCRNNLPKTSFCSIKPVCDHPTRWWRIPWSGEWIHGPHPPLRGKQWAIPAEDWKPWMLTPFEPRGEYITREMASYPPQLNSVLADSLCEAALIRYYEIAEVRSSEKSEMIRVGSHGNSLVRRDSLPLEVINNSSSTHAYKPPLQRTFTFSSPLKGVSSVKKFVSPKVLDNIKCIGGLRSTARSVAKVPQLLELGARIRQRFDTLLDKHPDIQQAVLNAIGAAEDSDDSKGPNDSQLELCRNLFWDAMGLAPDNSPVDNHICKSNIRAHLLHTWTRLAGDPDLLAASWPSCGAPAGLTQEISDPGIFPDVGDSAKFSEIDDPHALFCDTDTFVNYSSVEDDPKAMEEVEKFWRAGYLAKFNTLEECKSFVGGDPILSKLAMITKEKNGRIKRRLVLDCKRSGIVKASFLNKRILLPRIIDAVHDHLDLSAIAEPWEEVEMFILDFLDAFWQLPNHPEERRFFVIKIGGKYFVYLRTAQGTRNAPTTWGRFAALTCRLTQSLFCSGEVRLKCYVDDPNTSVKGTLAARNRSVAIICLTWQSLGLGLAYPKGARGSVVVWIGCVLSCFRECVKVTLTAEFLDGLRDMIRETIRFNVVSLKLLRSLAGKANRMATVVYTWTPFLNELWAAIQETLNPTGTSLVPLNCCWVNQIRGSLQWMLKFLEGVAGSLTRTYLLSAHMGLGDKFTIITDASPWGMGGVLLSETAPIKYFALPLSKEDIKLFEFQIGDHRGQQVWESLCMLIALRLWKSYWFDRPTVLCTKADNVTTLVLISCLKAKGGGTGIIARELALDLGEAAHAPAMRQHISGIENSTCDSLSRLFQPGKNYQVPPSVSHLRPDSVPDRPRSWYKSLGSC